jgi:hypothetical protein
MGLLYWLGAGFNRFSPVLIAAFFCLNLRMKPAEIKDQIHKVIDNFPDAVLKDLLSFLSNLQTQPSSKIKLTTNLRRILEEDKELLEKLAK